MDSPRWYHEIDALLNEFIFNRNLLRETIALARELRQHRDVRELRQKLRELEANFVSEIMRIQREMRREQ